METNRAISKLCASLVFAYLFRNSALKEKDALREGLFLLAASSEADDDNKEPRPFGLSAAG